MIKVSDGRDEASAILSADGTGWIVKVSDGFDKERRFYAFSGGAWKVDGDGTLGSQWAGTADVKAPRNPARMRTFLKSHVLGTV
jgi:hypothetical protein